MCRASWDVLRRPQRQIQTGADGGTSAHVDPEYYLHDVQKPRASVWDAILADRDEDCGRPIQHARRLETTVSAPRKRGRTRQPVYSSQLQIKRTGTKNAELTDAEINKDSNWSVKEVRKLWGRR